jgi:3-dehydroquinate dehydratase-2|tara:strand:+ start:1387 stop:1827 length:441 start_codon:yes stop_codon:yes gene_type:complete
MVIHIVHGSNLDRLGNRQLDIYGSHTLDDQVPILKGWLDKHWPNVELKSFQSNIEGEIINYMHSNNGSGNAFLINPGAFTHTSVAISDSIAGLESPVLEVHLSHTYARESYRRNSLLAAHTCGTISGLGWIGYRLGIEALLSLQKD